MADDLWLPRNWAAQPSTPTRDWPWPELVIIGLVLAWNLITNLLIPDSIYIPVNLVTVALLIVLAHTTGTSFDHLGMRPDRVKRGIRVGAVTATVVLVIVAGLAAFSPTREFLADDRFLGVGTSEALFEALVRIPVGTAAAEEIVFRGVLLGMFLRHMSPLAAVLFSSVLFGFWHVIPALDSIQTNPAGDLASGSVAVAGIVAGQVLATAAAGSVLAWLRFRANSLVAPITVHFAINSIAYMAGWLIVSGR